MKTIKKSIVLLFSASLLFLGGCAKNHNDIILHKTTSFWTGSPVIKLDVPYPEPLTFELPSAEWTPLKIQKKEGVNTRVELATLQFLERLYVLFGGLRVLSGATDPSADLECHRCNWRDAKRHEKLVVHKDPVELSRFCYT